MRTVKDRENKMTIAVVVVVVVIAGRNPMTTQNNDNANDIDDDISFDQFKRQTCRALCYRKTKENQTSSMR